MIEFTKEQQAAIDARGEILVTAAAGSGKTAVLTERVINRVTNSNDKTDIDRLLIVTFTRLAQAEMRSRIENNLQEKADKNPDDENIKHQLLLLPSANILTIDAFCSVLVKDNFHALGIEPDFSMLDDAEEKSLLYSIALQILSEKYDNPTEDFDRFIDKFSPDGKEEIILKTIINLYNFTISMPQPEIWRKNALEQFTDNGIIADVMSDMAEKQETLIRKIETVLENVPEEFNRIKETLTSAVTQLQGLILLLKEGDYSATRDYVLNLKVITYPRETNAEKELACREQAKEAVSSFIGEIKGIKEGFFAYSYKYVLEMLDDSSIISKEITEMCNEMSARFEAEMKARNKYTFSAIEHKALELLATFKKDKLILTDYAKKLNADFDEVMVDEYQDVNDLQECLFYALSDEGKKLFTVGDVKQSIYSFRHANPSNFLRKKEQFLPYKDCGTQGSIALNKNFRSRRGVCDFVNFFFSLFMKKDENSDIASLDYNEDEKLNVGANFPENNQNATEIHIVTSNDYSDYSAQAVHVAEYIKNLVNGEPFLKKNDTELRKAKYGDFALLLASPSTSGEYYAEEFSKRNIPYSISKVNIAETYEYTLILSLLKVIDNTARDIPLASVMISPLFNFTDDELASYKMETPKGDLYSMLLFAAEHDKKAADFLNTIEHIRNYSVTMPIAEFFVKMLDELSMLPIISALENGKERRENAEYIISLVEGYDGAERSGVSGLVRYFDSMGELQRKKNDEEAVRIMSIHSSKGLQFPVCIVSACASAFNKLDYSGQVVISKKYGMAFEVSKYKGGEKIPTPLYYLAAKNIRQEKTAEYLRLMYVAQTRAEEKLVFVIKENKAEDKLKAAAVAMKSCEMEPGAPFIYEQKNFADMLYMAAVCHPSLKTEMKKIGINMNLADDFTAQPISLIFYNIEPDDIENEKRIKEKAALNPEKVKMIENRFGFVYPYEKVTKIQSKTSVTSLTEKDSNKDYSFNERPAFLNKHGLTAADKGTATHRFMQFANFCDAENDVKAELDRLVEWEFLSEAEGKAVDVEKVACFFKSELYNELKSADWVRKEQRFVSSLKAVDENGKVFENEYVTVQGMVDCMFSKNGKITVIDFKTDRVDDPQILVERYRSQISVYASAMEKAYSEPIEKKIIYSVPLAKSINID